VLQCFLGCYPFLGVVDEYPPEEVEELTVEVGVGWYCFLGKVSRLTNEQCDLRRRTGSFFIALTYFFEALLVSALG